MQPTSVMLTESIERQIKIAMRANRARGMTKASAIREALQHGLPVLIETGRGFGFPGAKPKPAK